MGIKNHDLTPLVTAIAQAMQETMPGTSFSGSGTMDFYLLYEVVDETATQYLLSEKIGTDVTMDLTFSGGYGGQEFSGTMQIETSGIMESKVYVNKSDLSMTGGSFTLDFIIRMSGGAGMMGSYAGTMKISGEGDIILDPPLDLFDFPISVGENWSVQSTATMEGSATLTMDFPLVGKKSMEVPLDFVEQISLTAVCPTTAQVQTAEGKTVTAYQLQYSGTGAGSLVFPGVTLYYSPEEGVIVQQQIDFSEFMKNMTAGTQEEYSAYGLTFDLDERVLFTAAPMTPAEAAAGIEAVGRVGIDFFLILVIAVVVGLVVVVALALRRRSAPSWELPETGSWSEPSW
jgi:hypothetical protein